jgi:uncharacterized protein
MHGHLNRSAADVGQENSSAGFWPACRQMAPIDIFWHCRVNIRFWTALADVHRLRWVVLGRSGFGHLTRAWLTLDEQPCEPHGESGMSNPAYTAYEAAAPYFDLVREALGDLVDGQHFFDVITDSIIYEVLYDFPGWPRVIQGRVNLMAQFRGYGENIQLQSADKLITHKADDGRAIVIEYEVHGTVLATGAKYDNRFCSIIEIENRKIAHWRDYMDSLAAWNALTAHSS